jgi:hypothetical protein
MKKEDILENLRVYVREEDMTILINLIEKLEKDIREETSYNGNSKSKISAIKNVCKYSEKLRPALTGYNIAEDGKYEITDSYRAFRLNKMDMPVLRVGTEKTEEEIKNNIKVLNFSYPNLKNVFPAYNEEERVILDIKDIVYKYKIRNKKDKRADENYYMLKSKSYTVYVDIIFLKETIDILGQDLKVSITGELKPIYFENNSQEQAIVLPIKKY